MLVCRNVDRATLFGLPRSGFAGPRRETINRRGFYFSCFLPLDAYRIAPDQTGPGRIIAPTPYVSRLSPLVPRRPSLLVIII